MGYGDEIFATAEVKKIKEHFPNSEIIIGDGRTQHRSIIYLNNPKIWNKENVDEKKDYIWVLNYFNNRPYIDYVKSDDNKFAWDTEFTVSPGEIYLSDQEKAIGLETVNKAKLIWENNFKKKNKIIIVIEPNVKGLTYAKNVGSSTVGDSNINRDWGFEKWQEVVNILKDKILFIQTVRPNIKKLTNVIHIDCNFRGALSIMFNSNLFLGTQGGLSHAAGAFNKDAIIIFGGWISPSMMGYDFHTNIYVDLPESPCGSKKICKHCKKCMNSIKVKKIISLLEEKITSQNKKL